MNDIRPSAFSLRLSGLQHLAFSLQPSSLRSSRVTVGAVEVVIAAGVDELLPAGGELLEFGAGALRQDGMAGVAIVGFDRVFAVVGFMRAVVATETAGPDHVADIVRIAGPIGFHLWEEIFSINLVRLNENNFLQTLRNKLSWGFDTRN